MDAEPGRAPAADPFRLLFVGTHGWVAALDRFTGTEAWRACLPDTGWSVVTQLVEEGVLYAASKGHVFAIDPATGEVFWKNDLPSLGNDHACLATMRSHAAPVAQIAREITDESSRHGGG